jgi:ribonucleoside-diphosphate reductase alpha chain
MKRDWTLYQEFIYVSRYSRYLDREKRRETWQETVKRYFDFFEEFLAEKYGYDMKPLRAELETAVLERDVMPSMRGLMTAGPALRRDEGAVYNCAYLPMDSLRSLDETLYTLMLGTGIGFSVESENTSQTPTLPDEFYDSDTTVIFEDSRIGWAKGYKEYVALLSNGQIPKYDVSKIRPAGARLKTFGGRASGPQPLVELLEFTKSVFIKAAGRTLSPLELHDLECMIGYIVVVGGVRRSAEISLSDLNDTKMRDAKSGNWYLTNPHRRLANNSAVYNEKPDIGIFMREWLSLYDSKSGERGIVSRKAMKRVIDNANEYRRSHAAELTNGSGPVRYRETNYKFGTNPCSEIILRPYQFCNLTSVQVYPEDTEDTLRDKVRLATILGTFQSCLTNFRYLNKKWQRNCEDERLLGVSLNGVFDNKLTNGTTPGFDLKSFLQSLKREAIVTNMHVAHDLGINSSVAITCVKPEGTTSAFVGTSSGIHPAHSQYYVRYVRNDIKDPLTSFMMARGFPYERDYYDPNNMVAFKFPIKSSPDSVFRKKLDVIQHLELWKVYQQYYCEHKPSVTISVREDEWLKVGAWVYENFEWASGISFLPAEETGMIYKQAPFTECGKSQYEELLTQMPEGVDWRDLVEFEKEDTTTSSHEYACVGSAEGCLI